jgi:hypothetical protein
MKKLSLILVVLIFSPFFNNSFSEELCPSAIYLDNTNKKYNLEGIQCLEKKIENCETQKVTLWHTVGPMNLGIGGAQNNNCSINLEWKDVGDYGTRTYNCDIPLQEMTKWESWKNPDRKYFFLDLAGNDYCYATPVEITVDQIYEMMNRPELKYPDDYLRIISKLDIIGQNLNETEITPEFIENIQSDLKNLKEIVVLLQALGYDGTAIPELKDGNTKVNVSFYNKQTSKPFFDVQIPDGTLAIFYVFGLMEELKEGGMEPNHEQKTVLIKSSLQVVKAITNFDDEDIPSSLALASIGKFHPSTPTIFEIPAPLKQLKMGFEPDNIICKADFVLKQKISDGSPVCIKNDHVEKINERGFIRIFG